MNAVAAPLSPYKGLAAFGDSDLDAFFFFGRERERDIIVANLIAARLTLLYGPTGVGKSSVLRAGVTHRLRELAQTNLVRTGSPEHAVVVVDAWADDPREAVLDAVSAELEMEAAGPLVDALRASTAARDVALYLILDQFEEYFLYHDGGDAGPLGLDLPELLTSDDLHVNVLLSLREDALAQLDAFKGRIPNLFANVLRLERLDRRSARAAIVGPIDRYNELVGRDAGVSVEPALVESLLDEVAAGKVDVGGAGIGEVPERQTESRIEAPYLQLVLERLWERERSEDSKVMRVSTLHELGGAEAIVRAHLERALDSLSPAQRDVAASVFNHLVTPSGTKIAHRTGDLAEYASVGREELAPVLGALGRERIVRAVDGSDGATERYEIFHDVLADAVLAWRARLQLDRQRLAAERRQRRLLWVTAAALVALAVMSGITAYAFIERSHAQAQTRHSRAGELATGAVSNLDTDPQRSLEGAVQAAALDSSPRVEEVLRQALLAARQRRVMHTGSKVRFVAYSPDGTHVLTGSANGLVRIWRARGGRPALSFGAGRPLAAAAYDKRGRRILTASGNRAQLWDANSGMLLETLPHRGIAFASFAADGARVITAGGDRRVRFWRSTDGRLLRVVRFRAPVVLAGSNSNSSRLVALIGPQGKARAVLVNERTRRVVRALPQRGIADASFSPDGRLLATAGGDGTTQLWRARDGRRMRVLDDGSGRLTDLDFSPDGSWLATASIDGGVRVWRVSSGDRWFYFLGHKALVTQVVFDPTGSLLVSTSLDRTARVWQISGIEAGRPGPLLTGHTDAVRTAAFNADGSSLVTGGDDGTGRIWDTRVEQRLQVAVMHKVAITHAVFSHRGGLVDVHGSRIESRANGRVVGSFTAGSKVLTLSRDGGLVVSADPAGAIKVRRLPMGQTIVVLRSASSVTALALRGDGRQLVTAGTEGLVTLWAIPGGQVLHRYRIGSPVTRVALSPNGDVVVTADRDGTVRLWSPTGQLLHVLRGHPAAITDARFDPTGSRLVTASQGASRNLIEWDVRTGDKLHVLIGHFGAVNAASFSSDGRWILTAGPISAAIWAADTGQLLFYLRGHTDLLTDAEWSPTGYRVVTASRDRTVRTYDCKVCQPLSGLRALAHAQLAATTNTR